MTSQLSYFENVLKMIQLELKNLSQFKETRVQEIKRLKSKIFKIKQHIEQSAFILEEKNVKYQDLLVQAGEIEKKIEKLNNL